MGRNAWREISGTVKILKNLSERRIQTLGLTNWSSETFPVALKRFKFLRLFSGIVVSGEEKQENLSIKYIN